MGAAGCREPPASPAVHAGSDCAWLLVAWRELNLARRRWRAPRLLGALKSPALGPCAGLPRFVEFLDAPALRVAENTTFESQIL